MLIIQINFMFTRAEAINEIITVGKFGGDYATIQKALDYARDSASNPVTILIEPGVYYESLDISKGRHISLVGVDKKTCIIRNDSCELYKQDLSDPYDGGALYFHNQQYNGATNQKLIVKNSKIESEVGVAIRVEDANHRTTGGYGDSRDTTISFYNNVCWSNNMLKKI